MPSRGRVPVRRALLRRARALMEAVDGSSIPSLVPASVEAERIQNRIRAHVNSYLAAQASVAHCGDDSLEVVAIAGSAGVGKSALFNFLAGAQLAPVSPLSPTTRKPLALVHPYDEESFHAHPLAGESAIILSPLARRGVVLVDCPPFDRSDSQLSALAQFVLDVANRVVFVTTIYRYGDAAAWEALRPIAARGVPTAGVLNRVGKRSDGVGEGDFLRLWREIGLSSARVASVAEGELALDSCKEAAGDLAVIEPGVVEPDAGTGIRRRRRRGSVSQRTSLKKDVDKEPLHQSFHQRGTERIPRRLGRLERRGLSEIQRWISLASDAHAHASVSRAKPKGAHKNPESPHRNSLNDARFNQLRADVDLLANIADSFRNALVDAADRAREGAAAPLEKLATNIAMGRFGQGAPTALWERLTAPNGVLAGVKAENKPGLKARANSVRDGEITALFHTIQAAVSMALSQALTTAVTNIESLWGADFIDHSAQMEWAHEHLDVSALVLDATRGWEKDVREIAASLSSSRAACTASSSPPAHHAWFGPAGVAGLIGVASSGLAGAMELARELGYEQAAWDARDALTGRVRAAMEECVHAYTDPLARIHLPDSEPLRASLKDFLDSVQRSDR